MRIRIHTNKNTVIDTLLLPYLQPSAQWIVAATSQPPTPSLRQLADRKDWQLLVLGQVAGLEGWDAPIGGAIYLSLQDQKESGYRVTPLLLPGSFPWRNIGYLYAIEVCPSHKFVQLPF